MLPNHKPEKYLRRYVSVQVKRNTVKRKQAAIGVFRAEICGPSRCDSIGEQVPCGLGIILERGDDLCPDMSMYLCVSKLEYACLVQARGGDLVEQLADVLPGDRT